MVVIKKNKSTKDFHEYLLAATYSVMSVLMAHPSVPPPAGKITLENEGNAMRDNLKRLGIINKTNSIFAKSMDIASFLASVIDFEQSQYDMIEEGFREGYISVVRRNFPYLYLLLRNILSLGFASDQSAMIQNMTKGYRV